MTANQALRLLRISIRLAHQQAQSDFAQTEKPEYIGKAEGLKQALEMTEEALEYSEEPC